MTIKDNECEYFRAIPYGRPLFARMKTEKRLADEALANIADRMLIRRGNDWSLETSRST